MVMISQKNNVLFSPSFYIIINIENESRLEMIWNLIDFKMDQLRFRILVTKKKKKVIWSLAGK